MKTELTPATSSAGSVSRDSNESSAASCIARKPLPSEEVASRLMETVPYIMYYMRSNILRKAETPASLPQLRVMSYIYNCPGSSLSRLAESIGVANATASTMVERLVKAGMVVRLDDPASRRNVVLSLSEAGVEHLLASRSISHTELTRLMAQLPAEKLESIEEALTLLKGVFTEANSQISQPCAE